MNHPSPPRDLAWPSGEVGENGPVFLVVEDYQPTARAIARLLRREGTTLLAHTVRDGLELIRSAPRVDAAIVDIRLPDGSGFDVLEALRKRETWMPVLVASSLYDHETISRAQVLGALYVRKPVSEENLSAFVQRIGVRDSEPRPSLMRLVRQMAARYELSGRESELLFCVASGVALTEAPDHLGVLPSTVKTLTRRLLRKCEASSLDSLVGPLQRMALQGKLWGQLPRRFKPVAHANSH